jgi:hypothetical protein
MAQKNFSEAIEAFRRRLQFLQLQCSRKTESAEHADAYADGHRKLGITLLAANSNSEALTNHEAIDTYRSWTPNR